MRWSMESAWAPIRTLSSFDFWETHYVNVSFFVVLVRGFYL